MHNQEERSATKETTSSSAQGLEKRYFEFLAGMGITKHMGSINSTEALIKACHIDAGQHVLDVGCGVGITPCLLAKRYGCRATGIDITPEMIDKSKRRTKQEGLEDLVEFRIADARDLPFEDGAFDAVIVESVMVFLARKARAASECARVTRPAGYVGLNEMTLLKEPAPPKLVTYFEHTTGMRSAPPTAMAWQALLEGAGLQDVAVQGHKVRIRDEAKGRLKRFRPRDYVDGIWWLLRMYVTDPATRGFLKQVSTGTKLLTRDLFEYLGYGIGVGRKD
jgi:SAM-dependent methyltransferase